MLNPWYELGVNRQSSDDEIRWAFHQIATYTHPDKTTGLKLNERNECNRIWHKANEAYDILKNAERRNQFIREMMVTQKTCPECDGVGAQRKQQGLLKVTYDTCEKCDGAGCLIFIPDKASGLKGERTTNRIIDPQIRKKTLYNRKSL